MQESTKVVEVQSLVMRNRLEPQLSVLFSEQHLRRHVLRRPAEGVGSVSELEANLGEAEVCELQMPVLVQHYVLRLQVSVEDVVLVQVLYGFQDLCEVELGLPLSHSALWNVVELVEKLTAGTELKDQEQIVFLRKKHY